MRFVYAAFAVPFDFELAFLVDAALALDALLAAAPPVAAFLAVPRLVLDLALAFFSEDFLPAYVFLGASVFFAAGGLATGFGGLAEATGFLFVLVEDALVVAVFEDGALRAAEDLVVVALAVAAFDFDPGFVAGFAAAFVAGAVLVLEVGLFSLASSADLTAFAASFTRPDGPLGSEKTPFSAPTAIALLSCETWAFPISIL